MPPAFVIVIGRAYNFRSGGVNVQVKLKPGTLYYIKVDGDVGSGEYDTLEFLDGCTPPFRAIQLNNDNTRKIGFGHEQPKLELGEMAPKGQVIDWLQHKYGDTPSNTELDCRFSDLEKLQPWAGVFEAPLSDGVRGERESVILPIMFSEKNLENIAKDDTWTKIFTPDWV